MKVVLFGNTNNYLLILARALRRLGCDCELIVTHKQLLHRPENADPEFAQSYPDWMHDMSSIDEEDFAIGESRTAPMIALLGRADAVILNYLGPSLQQYIDRPAIALLTGSDLEYYANYDTVEARTRPWAAHFRRILEAEQYTQRWRELIDRQRRGILSARAVSFFPRGLMPTGDQLLDDIGVTSEQRFHIYMGDVDTIPWTPVPEQKGYVRIFCGARLTWKKPMLPGTCELDYKGIDRLLYGLRRFLAHSAVRIELRLVEKGEDVQETKALVERLGLSQSVTWLREMSRHAFLDEVAHADICVDNLGFSVVGMAGLDAMASGRPLIANARPEVYAELLPEPAPIRHAATPAEVCEQLARLAHDWQLRQDIGLASREFVARYWSPEANAIACLDRLGYATSGSRPEREAQTRVLS